MTRRTPIVTDDEHHEEAASAKRREREAIARVLDLVRLERIRQNKQWGEQNHPDGTGHAEARRLLADVTGSGSGAGARETAQALCELAFEDGNGTWAHILFEEVFEALTDRHAPTLRAELLQVAAVAVAWVEAIDRRRAK